MLHSPGGCSPAAPGAAVRQSGAVTNAEMGTGANPEWFLTGISSGLPEDLLSLKRLVLG